MSNVDHQPLVSVIMNCYNGEKYISKAVNSVLSQKYENWELVFWDDQSSDKSKDVFLRFADKRLRYFLSSERANLSSSRILAIDKSKGDIITFLDVDDYWDSCYLNTQVGIFTDESITFSCGNFFVVQVDSKKRIYRNKLPQGRVTNELLSDYSVGLLTLAIRRSSYYQSGGFSEKYHIIGDFDLVMRLSLKGNMMSFSKPLAYCLKHDENESFLKVDQHIEELEEWYFYNNNNFDKKSVELFYISIEYKKILREINNNKKTLYLIRRIMKHKNFKNIAKLFIKLLISKNK